MVLDTGHGATEKTHRFTPGALLNTTFGAVNCWRSCSTENAANSLDFGFDVDGVFANVNS
jgi:hypothetical protein